nr:UDP-N-acetylmuramoyl-tripeptide--D-alanyl-D-alanine ligase [Bacillus mesophilus]
MQDVLSVIEGKVVRGNPAQTIKSVASYDDHVITDHTLVFIKKKRKSFPLPQHTNSVIVVTSNPAKLKGVKEDTTVVVVENVKKAYFNFVDYYRNLFTLPVIGVTGTCGKTTTKEMISWILSKEHKVVSTIKSKNGLKRNLDYLMNMDETTDHAVFEMGVSGPNQLLYSAHYFKPQIGIITTIGTDHIEGFKSQDAYIREKASMISAVKNGTMILNSDDKISKELDLKSFKGNVVYVGTDASAHFRGHSISFNHEKAGMDFVLSYKGGNYPCFVPGYGSHNVYNALAALAATSLVGVSLKEAINRLQTFKHIERHLQFHDGFRGSLIIDDTWNTNPTSIQAALEVLRETAKGRKKVAIIGEIEELGQYSVAEHEKVGELVVNYDVDVLITIGHQSKPVCRKAVEMGMDPSAVYTINDKNSLLKLLLQVIDSNTAVLFKTSMRRSFKDVMKKLIK